MVLESLAQYALAAFVGVFVVLNPLTTSFVFISLMPRSSEATRRRIAGKAANIAFWVLLTFALAGTLIFQLFGITVEAFRIAGGLILFGIGMNMIRKHEGEHSVDISKDEVPDDIAIIPLAIPFMSGPATITTVVVLTAESTSLAHSGILILAIAVSVLAAYYSMVYSSHVVKYLGQTGQKVVTKLFGLILAVLAVQFVLDGIMGYAPKLAQAAGLV